MNTPVHNLRPRRQSGLPDVIFILLVTNGLMFALQQFEGFQGLIHSLALWPIGSPYGDFMPWQLVTYGFLHGDMTHILFNMFMLWMFGRELEHLMGSRRFLVYFMTGVVGAGLIQLVVASFHGGGYPTVGASGGVFALLLAFGMAFPNRMVMLIFPPIPMKAKYMVIMFGLLELYLGVSGSAPGVANFAHLGGMLFGYMLLRYWASPRRRG